MSSTISAGLTSGTALNFSGDTSGALVLQTNGTTTAVTISTAQVVTLAQPLPVASGGSGVTTSTGSGANVLGTSPTLTTPTFDSASLVTISGTAPLYMCRAWVNFNGTGTVAIRGSGNVSSITDRGVGLYTVNFTTAMPDTNYCYQICARDDDNGMGVPTAQADPAAAQPPTTTTLPIIYNYPPSQGFYDANAITVAIFR